MHTRQIGDRTVSAIGLGAMPLSRPHHATGGLPDRGQAIEAVHAALDAGVTLIDCADCYAPDEGPFGHNEELVAEALRTAGNPDVLVATKGGIQRDGAAWPICGRPDYIREAAYGSLSRLGVESIGLYQHHRPDPEVPYAETMGAFKDLYDEGVVQRRRPLQRGPRPDPRGARHPRRRPGQRAEPALAVVPHQRARARPLRRARPGLPAVEPARRHAEGPRARRGVPPLRRGGAGARRQPAPGRHRLAAGQVPERHPDPGRQPAGLDPRLRRGGPRRADRRRVRRAGGARRVS